MLRAAAVTALAATDKKTVSILNHASLKTESMNGVYGTRLVCDSPCVFNEWTPSMASCECADSSPYTFQYSLGLDWQSNFQDITFNCFRMVLAMKAEKDGAGNCYVGTIHGDYLMHTGNGIKLYDIPSMPHLYCDEGTQFQSSNAYFNCLDWPAYNAA